MRRRRKYRFKTRPWKHQVEAMRVLLRNNGGALFMEMGTGKTKVAIDVLSAWWQKKEVTHVIVLCPLSAMGVWRSQIHIHKPDYIEWRYEIHNYESLLNDFRYERLRRKMRKRKCALVCDESHKVKSSGAQRSRRTYGLAKECKYRIIMTGTPVAKDPLDVFQQYKILDEGVFGTSKKAFMAQYAISGGYMNSQVLKWINQKELRARVRSKAYIIKKEECLDLPPRVFERIPIELPPYAREVYDKMARDSIVAIQGREVEAAIVLVRSLRLAQIAGGWIGSEDGPMRIHVARALAFQAWCEECREQGITKLAVGARFLNEVADAASVAKRAGFRPILFYGKVNRMQGGMVRERRILDFHEAEDPVIWCAQAETGSEAVDLTCCSQVAWYTLTRKYDAFRQFNDRFHRYGQKSKVTYHVFSAERTVDFALWYSLRTKRDLASIVLAKPDLLIGHLDIKMEAEAENAPWSPDIL